MTLDAAIREAMQSAVAPLVKEIRELRQRIDPPKEWLTVPEAADHYNVSADTIRRWIRDGKIEAKGTGKARKVRV